jgi:hypothetical protein
MKYSDLKFKNGDRVMVSRLGDETPGFWPAKIVGLAVHQFGKLEDPANIWIVEWTHGNPIYNGKYPLFEDQYPFAYSTMPESCIDLLEEIANERYE